MCVSFCRDERPITGGSFCLIGPSYVFCSATQAYCGRCFLGSVKLVVGSHILQHHRQGTCNDPKSNTVPFSNSKAPHLLDTLCHN